MLKCAALDWTRIVEERIPVRFITLSIPEELWTRGRFCFRGLDKFRRWIEGIRGFQGAIVRRELGEKRGAVHYHLMVFGVPFPECRNVRSEVARKWTDCLDAADFPGVKRNGGWVVTDIEVANEESISKYLTKYCCKAAYEGKESEDSAGDIKGVAVSGGSLDVAGAWSQSHNGHRWWYIWGEPLVGQLLFHEFEDSVDPRKVIAHIRRMWRQVVKQRRLRQVIRGYWRGALSWTEIEPELFPTLTVEECRKFERQIWKDKLDQAVERTLRVSECTTSGSEIQEWSNKRLRAILRDARRFVKREERDRRRKNYAGLWRSTGFSIMFDADGTGDLLVWAAEEAAAGVVGIGGALGGPSP